MNIFSVLLVVLGVVGLLVSIVMMIVNVFRKKKKLPWVLGTVASIAIMIVGVSIVGLQDGLTKRQVAPAKQKEELSESVIRISSNLDALHVEKGMIAGKDFTWDPVYYRNFIRLVECSDIHMEGNVVTYTKGPTGSPYYIWVCYPQISKSSQPVLLCFDNDNRVIAITRVDTSEAIQTFGGTPGTRERGW